MSNLDILPVRNCLKRLAVCNHIDSVFLIYMAALLNIDSTSGTKFSPPKKGGENEYGIFTRKLLSPHADVTYIFFGPSVGNDCHQSAAIQHDFAQMRYLSDCKPKHPDILVDV